jgi:alginate O-acetyltransferase complex protein AlgI
MLFNSLHYLFFLFSICILYFALPHRFRLPLLLIGSYFFYMRWRWEYVFLIFGQTVVNFVCGTKIARAPGRKQANAWLASALVISLGTLFVFKYLGFASQSANALLSAAGVPYLIPHLDFLLPVGISFYTFQAMSYTIDVYRGDCPVETNFPRFALFVSFFPQLVAGPIERASHLLEQFKIRHTFDIVRFTEGMKLIFWGLFKKVVIADRLTLYVDRVYAAPEHHSGPSLLLATYFFAFQIYCDFSGYSDMAIGSARILGINLMQNFRLPYFATSIPDFWKRWHISLSTWFRDYLYLPLGGNRTREARWAVNILIVFLVSGLWHGANWTFVIWGGLHGAFYLLGVFFRKTFFSTVTTPSCLRPILAPLRILFTFHLVVFAWIFFRAANLPDAWLIAGRIFTDFSGRLYMGPSTLTTLLSVLLIGLLLGVQWLQQRRRIALYFQGVPFPTPVRWAGYLGMTLGILLLGKSSSEFIYFQF